MERPRATEGEERQPAIVDAAIGRMRARRIGHRLGDDAVDAARRLDGGDAEFGAETAERRLGRGEVELHLAAEEVVGVDQPEQEIGVGDRRRRPAASVAGRARVRSGAVRPDLEEAEIVDPRDRTAARADLDQID